MNDIEFKLKDEIIDGFWSSAGNKNGQRRMRYAVERNL